MDRLEKRAWPSLGGTPNVARRLFAKFAAGGGRVRGKDYNIGLRGGLIGQRHYDRMGSAIWLYAWLILRQKHQQGEFGLLLGRLPVAYPEIEERTGFNSRALDRLVRTSFCKGSIGSQTLTTGIMVQVTKAKKSTRFPQGVRKSAERLREVADRGTRFQPAGAANGYSNQELANPIGSSFVEGLMERCGKQVFHRDFHSPSKNFASTPQPSNKPSPDEGNRSDKSPATRGSTPRLANDWEQLKYLVEARRQPLRAECDEGTRRELAVGKDPEVRRR